jgi:hypothetical protein
MLQKIRNFFRGVRGDGSGLSYAGRQVDTAKAVTEMMEHAKLVGCDVVVTFEVGERRETMVCHPNSDAVRDLYQIIHRSRRYWLELWKKELDTDAQRRLCDSLEKKLDGEGWGSGGNKEGGDRTG